MATGTETTAPDVRVMLRADVFADVCAERGLLTKAARAKALGVDSKTLRRMIQGEDAAGIVAVVLALWKIAGFRRMFAVIDNATGEEVR